ncbi:MAG: hypothetical protein GX065_04950 [Firmicutes bacterium]|nr:hypothetical protein [Bacillota bacterium]
MRDVANPAGRGKMILTAILIAANLLMLAAGIIAIPPNLRVSTEGAPAGAKGSAVASAYSTGERPDSEDFLWYTEEVFYDGVPADAEFIRDFDAVTGGWKGIIIYDPENEYDLCGMELLNAEIVGSAEDLSLTLDWYMAIWLDEESSLDETDLEDTVFSGGWDGGLAASANSTVYLPQFYELNQKQYAVGSIDSLNDLPAYIALVRP